jgi:predicted SAM-dependent methyltransferase
LKINFACGYHTWDGFYCVDAVQNPRAKRPVDLLHTLRFEGERLLNPLPLEDDCADELHSIHFIEHVYAWEAPAVIREFRRLVKPGGLLVLELPDLEKACRNLLSGTKDQYSMWSLYGDPNKIDPFMCHRWGYTPHTIKTLLTENGFKRVQRRPPQFHGKRDYRDMRIEAR